MKKVLASAVLGAGAVALLNAPSTQAAPTFYFGDGKKLTIFQMVQVWTIYGLKYDIPGETNLKDNKADIYIRRGRFGFKGTIRKDLAFKVWFAYDNLGRDDLNPNDGARGAVKTSGLNYSKLEVWDAQFTWKANPEWANITIGYFRPQVGKESITSGFAVLTLEKGLPNFYVRRHIIGKPVSGKGNASGNGRIFNVTLGGLHLDEGWSLNYNFSIGDDQNYTNKSTWSPLLTARVAVSIGDPEMKKYKLGYKQTYFGKRKGVTIGLNYAHQGKGIDRNFNGGDKFDKNELYGVDILANYGPVDIVAEYDIMKRDWSNDTANKYPGKSYTDKVWEVRAGYLIKVGKQFIQPVVSYEKFKPDSNGTSIYSKKENTRYDIGINWYVNKQKLKINLHYAYGEVKNYKNKNVTPNVTGKVKAGYIGFGLQFIF